MTDTIDDIQVDEAKWRSLLQAIFIKAVEDYIKLYHPGKRKHTYLEEDFMNATDMFFDPQFRFMHFKNNDDEDMSLSDLLEEIRDEMPDIEQLQQYLVDAAKEHWDLKQLSTIKIPEFIGIEGHVYTVNIHDTDTRVDYFNKIIYLNSSADLEQELIQASLEIVYYHNDITQSKKRRKLIADAIFRFLKHNNALRSQ
jgi:hypothetical protein